MKKRIIAVDDDAGIPVLLKRVMPEYDVQVEGDCLAAFEAAVELPPDLFLLDIEVPGLRGTQLAEGISQFESLSHIPIIFLSAFVLSPENDGEPVLIAGHPAFGKPFDLAKLKQHIAEHLAEHATPLSTLCRLRRGTLAGVF